MCEGGFSYSVDCENLSTTLVLLKIWLAVRSMDGLGYNTYQYDKPTNDAGSDSALLPFVVAMIERTNETTEDSISSNCNVGDGDNVGYSAVGTGNTIVVTTCIYGAHRPRFL
jgi:hypothetical protein